MCSDGLLTPNCRLAQGSRSSSEFTTAVQTGRIRSPSARPSRREQRIVHAATLRDRTAQIAGDTSAPTGPDAWTFTHRPERRWRRNDRWTVVCTGQTSLARMCMFHVEHARRFLRFASPSPAPGTAGASERTWPDRLSLSAGIRLWQRPSHARNEHRPGRVVGDPHTRRLASSAAKHRPAPGLKGLTGHRVKSL